MTRNRPLSRQARCVLATLADRPTDWRHGYDVSRITGLSSGTLYPLLIRLHGRGLLDARWEAPEKPGRPARHAYRLSAAGAQAARDLAVEVPVRGRLSQAPA